MIRALAILLATLALAACSKSEPPPATPAKPALWEVFDGERSAGWLFGTIHALPDGSEWETPAIANAIENAGVLVVEVRDLDPARVAAVLASLAHDKPGPPLAERLAPAARRDLASLFERKAIPANRFDGLETWAAALAVSRLAGTTSTANGVDTALLARFANRPVAELEGAADQLAIFDALPEADQRRLLTAVIAELDDPDKDGRALAKAWLAGDLVQLGQVTRRGLLADPALYKALAANRNKAWVAKLAPMLENQRRPLVAVGTAHMIGMESLPALLAARGYTVRRIQ